MDKEKDQIFSSINGSGDKFRKKSLILVLIADLKSYFYCQLFILELDRSDSVNKKWTLKYW